MPEVKELYNSKIDIWALGCTLYEILTLKNPFNDDNINYLYPINLDN